MIPIAIKNMHFHILYVIVEIVKPGKVLCDRQDRKSSFGNQQLLSIYYI